MAGAFGVGLWLLAACGGDGDSSALGEEGYSSGSSRPGGQTGDGGPLDPGPGGNSSGTPGLAELSCSNGVRDSDETGIDCGGGVCPGCLDNDVCQVGSDCLSRVCVGGTCSSTLGCSDGTREGFVAVETYPNIAACSGGWSIPGLLESLSPACTRDAGNSSDNPTGEGCNVADLCQPGWHVCRTPAEVAARTNGNGCSDAAPAAGLFFLTRQSGSGAAACGEGTNDLFGCGSLAGVVPDAETCAPLNSFSHDLCNQAPLFQCGTDGGNELRNVSKNTPDGGGVLCCRDAI